MTYKFYIRKANSLGQEQGQIYDLEASFPGVHYVRMEGLETQGQVKNVYTETFPGEDGDLVYHPADINEKAKYATTKLSLTVVVDGENRRGELRRLKDLLTSGRFYWWDTARKLKAYCILTDEQTISQDTIKGVKFIETTFTLKNLWGRTYLCDDAGTLV